MSGLRLRGTDCSLGRAFSRDGAKRLLRVVAGSLSGFKAAYVQTSDRASVDGVSLTSVRRSLAEKHAEK